MSFNMLIIDCNKPQILKIFLRTENSVLYATALTLPLMRKRKVNILWIYIRLSKCQCNMPNQDWPP